MSDDSYFMSYSRIELYFAESLTLHLQEMGAKIWFDLQQLEPGCDWQKEIALGLKTCQGLIIIVSEASLKSPYVYQEWKSALDQSKKIYLAIFEAVSLEARTIKVNEEDILVDYTLLFERASAVIDMRSNFAEKTAQLRDALLHGTGEREPVPSPNQWKIPTKMPLANAYVLGAMAFLTLVTAVISFLYLRAALPMFILGICVCVYLGWQSYAFARRESYQGTRASLVIGSFVMLFFIPILVPVFVVAALLVFGSSNIHRSSPLGQGLSRPIAERVSGRKLKARSWLEKIAAFYGRTLIFRVMLKFFALMAIIITITSVLPSLFMGSAERMGVLFCATPLLLLISSVFVLGRTNRRLVEAGLGLAPKTGITYRIIGENIDLEGVAPEIDKYMVMAGHQPVAQTNVNANFTLMILSEYTSEEALPKLDENSKGFIFILASWLSSDAAKRFAKYSHYQWVDFRRQRSIVLEGLAEDLLDKGNNEISYSYSTRILPQNFARVILPVSVASYISFQFFAFNLFVFTNLTRGISTEPLGINSLIEGLIVQVIGLWVANRVMKREITINWIVAINLFFTLGLFLIGFAWGLSQIPAGQRDNSAILPILIPVGIGSVLGFIIAQAALKSWLGSWLPYTLYRIPPFPNIIGDKDLWLRNLSIAVMVALLTFAFFGLPGDSSSPLLEVLREAPGLFNSQVVSFMTSIVP